MAAKRILQALVVVAVLAGSLAMAGRAAAGGYCSAYYTVQWGDTLGSIAAACGTTVDAVRAANPGLGWVVFAGDVLYIPTGYGSNTAYYPSSGTYTVRWGDSLGGIALAYGFSLSSLLAVNPQIWNANLIFPGQVISLPASSYNPYPSYPPAPNPYPAPSPSSHLPVLRVTYGRGLLVRTGPGRSNSEIVSPFVSAVKNTDWRYRPDSLTTDSIGFVWVEVQISPLSGYSTGWILVRDSLGNYFTRPNLGPKITPNDP